MNAKERNLLKGAIRRVFARSELRQQVLDYHTIEHSDPQRPRVKKWAWCNLCGEVVPRYTMTVDHIAPLVPLDTTLEHMSWDTLISRAWCDRVNLQGLCPTCHLFKSKVENQIRREFKKHGKRSEAA